MICAIFWISPLLLAATFKLYLTDGNYHIVREYKVEGDRVKLGGQAVTVMTGELLA